ncbi:MAG: hypothetical protein E7576_12135 [Ruminococcaceae bacterium]|nr:hypothetical protein [Oscillospiraceae bacterium]
MEHTGRTIAHLAVTVLFFLSCAFFSLGMLIPGAAETADGGDMPRLLTEEGISPTWRDDFENWFSKHFAYRDRLVTAYSHLREFLFRTGNDQVIVGKDGFLFFSETLDCYTGENPMTAEELESAAEAVANLSDYAADCGVPFLFVCAPNKNTVYGEYMPDTIPQRSGGTDASDLTRLRALLNGRGVKTLDLRPILAAEKENALLYHKRDTHWNAEGARIAAKAILEAAGRTVPVWMDQPLTVVTKTFEGDLDSLLYPGEERYDEDFVLSIEDGFIYKGNYRTPMDMRVETENVSGEGHGSVLMFRDSFGNALIPQFGNAAEHVLFNRANPYRIDMLDGGGYDLVILEIAERNLRDLIGSDARAAGES